MNDKLRRAANRPGVLLLLLLGLCIASRMAFFVVAGDWTWGTDEDGKCNQARELAANWRWDVALDPWAKPLTIMLVPCS